jgi:hypothetical protein
MALYNKSAFGPPYKSIVRMQTGTTPQYLFGNYNSDQQPWEFHITQVAVASNVVTATVQLVAGGGAASNGVPAPAKPAVGAVMGVQGTTKNAGALNVDPTTVSSVTLDANGAGTITYAATTANLAAVADSGAIVVRPYEYGDAVVAGTASAPIAQTFTPDDNANERSMFAEAVWTGTLPTTATVVLEIANVDLDGRYYVAQNEYGLSTAGVVAQSDLLASVAGGVVTQNAANYAFLISKFVRAKVLTYTGGDSTTQLSVSLFA